MKIEIFIRWKYCTKLYVWNGGWFISANNSMPQNLGSVWLCTGHCTKLCCNYSGKKWPLTPHTPIGLPEGGCGGSVFVVIDELDLSRCIVRRWHSRAALASHPSFLLLDDETFVGRSLQASFTEAAGNNIVPAFGCVRSHISGCSIRNRPQCGTINPWPQQQICAVTAQHGAINQT